MPLTISKNVTILGYGISPSGGSPDTSISGFNLTDSDGVLFYIEDSPTAKVSVTFRNLTLNGGSGQVTGIWGVGYGVGSTINIQNSWIEGFGYSGADADGMNLNVQNSLFIVNSSPQGGGGLAFTDFYGYGGNLTISQSSFIQNQTTEPGTTGGAIFYGGVGTSSLVNSTLADNSSNGDGGGIELSSLGGTFSINGSTVAYNNCGSQSCGGGGVDAFAYSGTYSMNASIVAGNVDDPLDQDADDWNSDGSVAESNSIIQASLWGIDVNDKGGNDNGANPFPGYTFAGAFYEALGVGPYGGTDGLPVVYLPPSSPAIDYLSSLNLTTDQRGFPRSVNTGHSKTFDIGAFEYDPNTQAETMTVPGSSATLAVVSGTGYSNGAGLELKATKVNDYVLLWNPTATDLDGNENYAISARFATGPSEGEVQVKVNTNTSVCSSAGPFQSVGNPVELYAAKAGFISVSLGTVDMDSDNPNCYQLLVTGKNKSSSGYSVYVDYINSAEM